MTSDPSDTPAAPEIIARLIKSHPYTTFSYVAQNAEVERVRATKYARTIAGKLASTLASSAAETARLREERDEAIKDRDQYSRDLDLMAQHANAVSDLRQAAEAEKEAMRVERDDLLEALKYCLREHGGFTIKGQCEQQARAAIARAEAKPALSLKEGKDE